MEAPWSVWQARVWVRYIWGLPGVQITSGHSQLVTNTDCLRAGARACACLVGGGGGHLLLMIIDRDKWLRVEIVYMPLIIKQQHNQATIPSEPQRCKRGKASLLASKVTQMRTYGFD